MQSIGSYVFSGKEKSSNIGEIKMNYLEPISSYLFAHDYSQSYAIRIRRFLFKNHEGDNWVKMVVLPSFEPEYMFSLEQKNNGYYIQASKANKQIYSNKDLKDDKITNRSRKCSIKMAQELKKLWCDVLLKTRYPQEKPHGFDGVSYYFSAFKSGDGLVGSPLGWVEGKTWSPNEGLPFDMVEIGNRCFSYAYDQKTSEKNILSLMIKIRKKYKIVQDGN